MLREPQNGGLEMVVMENGESSDETKLNERRAIMQTRVISWWKSGKVEMGIKWGKCLFLQLFLHFFSSRYVLLPPFYAFIFGVGNNARSWRKSCGRLSAQMRILCLPQKVAERKENSAQKKKILFAIFPAAGIVTNDATAPFHRTKELP